MKKSTDDGSMIEDIERIENDDISDHVRKGSVVAVMSESESKEFYMFKCSSKQTLVCREVDALGEQVTRKARSFLKDCISRRLMRQHINSFAEDGPLFPRNHCCIFALMLNSTNRCFS